MIPVLATLKAASLTTRLIVYGVLLALIAGLLWWAVGAPRVALSSARADLATLQATHDGLVTKLAEAEASAKAKSEEVRTAYDQGVAASSRMREQEVSNAYERGKAAGERIRAGTSSVRTVWRDRECPATADGSGAGSGEGAAQVSGDRAEAIGRVIGIGGAADATYSEALRRLEQAQKIVNACYEKPHVEQ
jgi:hypothetical protein